MKAKGLESLEISARAQGLWEGTFLLSTAKPDHDQPTTQACGSEVK